MEEIIKIVLEYVAIWAPSLVSILAIITTILTAINKTKEQIEKMKADTDFKAIKEQLEKNAAANAELTYCYKLALDEMTKIRNYADLKKKEE